MKANKQCSGERISKLYVVKTTLTDPELMARTDPSVRSNNMMPDMFILPIATFDFTQLIYWFKPLLFSSQLTSKRICKA